MYIVIETITVYLVCKSTKYFMRFMSKYQNAPKCVINLGFYKVLNVVLYIRFIQKLKKYLRRTIILCVKFPKAYTS